MVQMKMKCSNLLRHREDRFYKIKSLSSTLTIILISHYIISIRRIIFPGLKYMQFITVAKISCQIKLSVERPNSSLSKTVTLFQTSVFYSSRILSIHYVHFSGPVILYSDVKEKGGNHVQTRLIYLKGKKAH